MRHGLLGGGVAQHSCDISKIARIRRDTLCATLCNTIGVTARVCHQESKEAYLVPALKAVGIATFYPFSSQKHRLQTPLSWYKCQNSQNAQKCLRDSAKSDLVSLGRESQKSLSVSHRAKHPKHTVSHRARDCSATLTPEARKHLSHSPFSTFGHFAVLTLVPVQRGRKSKTSFKGTW